MLRTWSVCLRRNMQSWRKPSEYVLQYILCLSLSFLNGVNSSIRPIADATDVLQPSRLIVLTLYPPPHLFERSHVRHQVSPRPSSERWNCVGKNWPVILPEIATSSISGIFYMPQIYDMGPMALLPLRRKACWGFFRPEKSWRLRPGLNPRTSILKGITLPLDHQSHLFCTYSNTELSLSLYGLQESVSLDSVQPPALYSPHSTSNPPLPHPTPFCPLPCRFIFRSSRLGRCVTGCPLTLQMHCVPTHTNSREPTDAESHLRRPKPSTVLSWKPQISQKLNLISFDRRVLLENNLVLEGNADSADDSPKNPRHRMLISLSRQGKQVRGCTCEKSIFKFHICRLPGIIVCVTGNTEDDLLCLFSFCYELRINAFGELFTQCKYF